MISLPGMAFEPGEGYIMGLMSLVADAYTTPPSGEGGRGMG